MNQLDSTAFGLEKPVSKCSIFGGEGDSSIPSPGCHQSSPYRGQDYTILYMAGKLSPNLTRFTRELVKHVLGMGYFSAFPLETRKHTNTSPTSPFAQQLFYFNMILGTCGLSAGSESPPVVVLPKGLLASNSVAHNGSRQFLKMTDICAGEPPLCPTGSPLGRMAHTRPAALRLPKGLWSVAGILYAYQYIMRVFAA